MSLRRWARARRWAAGGLLAASLPVCAQNLSYDTGKVVTRPEYATLRIGNFYSTMTFHAAVSYRYTTSSGTGTDYLVEGQRGRILEDGSDFPVILAMDFLNYIPLSAHSDVDLSVRAAYRYFPLHTQENEWTVTLPDESISASLSTTYRLARTLNGVVYDRIEYVTDYVDFRGNEDPAAGRPFERVENDVGTTLNWMLSEVSSVDFDLSRQDVIVTDNKEEFGDQERTAYQEGAAYSRNFFGKIAAGARLGATQTDYKDETRPDTSQQDFTVFVKGSDAASGGIPLTDATTLSLSLGTSAGYEDSTDTQASDRTTAVTGSAALRTQLSKNLAHELSYERGLQSGFNTAFEEYSRWGYFVDYAREGAHIRVYSRYETVDALDRDQVPYDQWVSGIELNYPLLTYLTLDMSYDYRVIYNHTPSVEPVVAADGTTTAPADPAESQEDYYTRTAGIGTSLAIYKEVFFRVYVQRYERLSDLNELEFTRDTFEASLVYSRQL